MENEYQLSPEEATLIAEYDNAIADLQAQKRGALQAILRVRKLDGGPWRQDGSKLVREQQTERT